MNTNHIKLILINGFVGKFFLVIKDNFGKKKLTNTSYFYR